jgi:heptosyltransferase-2
MTDSKRILICGVNWIGDAIMSMPALQTFRTRHPDVRITLLVKPRLRDLWRMHGVPDEVLELNTGWGGTWQTARCLREKRLSEAWVLPHSFRAALIPFLAGIPGRIGMPGHWRDAMLTRVVPVSSVVGGRHQVYEYLALMVPDAVEGAPEMPRMQVPSEEQQRANDMLAELPRPLIGLMPGAARGPSKQWPETHFARLVAQLNERRFGVVLMGASSDRPLCDRLLAGCPAGLNLAGQTDVVTWAGCLSGCDAVVANDSGGMHLAAALDRPVVALYGITDPARTGPLGARCRVLQKSTQRCRDVARDSRVARAALAAISPDEVLHEVITFLEK